MNSATIVQLVIGGFGVTGIVGAAVALFKLRPEVNQMAVTSTQAAASEWQKLYDQRGKELVATDHELAVTKVELAEWRDRAIRAETRLEGRA